MVMAESNFLMENAGGNNDLRSYSLLNEYSSTLFTYNVPINYLMSFFFSSGGKKAARLLFFKLIFFLLFFIIIAQIS